MEAQVGRSNIRLALIDYGMGNLTSVRTACESLGAAVEVVSSGKELSGADAIILPGVGAFGEAVKNLEARGFWESLQREVIDRQTPILGICLGMQLLADSSTEYGDHRGLGWIRGSVRRMTVQPGVRLPHVGWNNVQFTQLPWLFERVQQYGGSQPHFYFDHSYALSCDDRYVSATTDYGGEVIAAIQSGHIFGVQFHPEKSQVNGLRVLKQFVRFAEGAGRDG